METITRQDSSNAIALLVEQAENREEELNHFQCYGDTTETEDDDGLDSRILDDILHEGAAKVSLRCSIHHRRV